MGDYNVYVKNTLGKGGATNNRLSAKGSIARANSTKRMANNIKRVSRGSSNMFSQATSGSSMFSLSGGLKKAGVAGAVTGVLIETSKKVANFAINLKEATTGEQIWSTNARATLKTITSLGTNYISGHIQNELFNKRVISRQNYGLDYGRELFNINVEGSKNKRI